MPLEIGTTAITGRRPDFSLISSPNGTVIGGSSERDDEILGRYIRAQESVGKWISEKKQQVNQQHEKNMQAIDAENENDIKAEGGLGTTMDISTPNKTVVKEKNILVKLYMTKESKATEKLSQSKGLFFGQDVLHPQSPGVGNFVQAGMMSVRVDQYRLVNWANSYEAARLSQVYAESARRLRERENALKQVEAAQAALAQAELQAAHEQARLKQYPASPPSVSLDENLLEAKRQNDYFKNGGSAYLFSWFYTKVRNGGEFDYKQRGRQYASFGNFNYGAAGTAAGISEAVLLRAAGAAQTVAGTSQAEFDKWWSEAPYGDDPVDQVWIKAGIEYAKSKGY